MLQAALLVVILAQALGGATPIEEAEKLYQRTEYQASLKLLSALPEKTAAAYLLMGKNYYMAGEFKKATEVLEKAVELEPKRSDYYHWLGRAYGRRAETSSFFTAPGYASRARQNLEKAVELDPRNKDATYDLFEYYLQAPGFLGGGLEKAQRLMARLKEIDEVEYYYAQAQLAESRKEFQRAEQQLRRAAELAPRQAGRVLDLARFLAQQGRVQESEAVLKQAEKIDPNEPRILFERANAYIRSKKNIEEARELLKKYIASPLTPEHPSRREAEQLLRQTYGG
ncbi:MAG: tetratricopeptide repeat protein [Bryobacteraceae bacterium]